MDNTQFTIGFTDPISHQPNSQIITIKQWMDGIEVGNDYLTNFDRLVDGQIGALGDAAEYIFGTTRQVLLFEFRDLGSSFASNFERDVVAAENAIMSYHTQYAGTPQRRVKRDNSTDSSDLSSCPAVRLISTTTATPANIAPAPTTTIPASITPAPTLSCVLHNEDPDQGVNQAFCVCEGSETLSPLSVASTGHQSDSCAYTTIPSTKASETVTTLAATYTTNCQVCTEIQLNAPACTSIPGCYVPAAVSQFEPLNPFHIFVSSCVYSYHTDKLNRSLMLQLEMAQYMLEL